MSLNHRILVPMPPQKITYKKGNNNVVYVYYTIRSYRRESDGKPTSDEVGIGRKDLETGMLIPNTKYYELFNVSDAQYTPLSIRTYGTFYLLNHISETLKLKEALKNVFPKCWTEILTVAMYMVCRNNIVKHCNYWCEETYNELASPLLSQRISELFSSISFDERMKFFKLWAIQKTEDEYIAYDVTSISSYSNKINDVEYGYNRDGDDLPQINLGMFTGEISKLPIFYNTYAGSITDKEQLQYMMRYAKEIGINKVKFVMDKGFYKKDNLRFMIKEDNKFIICLSNSFLFTRNYIGQVKPFITNHMNWIQEYQFFGYCTQYTQDGVTANLHIIFNPDKQVDEQKGIYSTIEKLEQELKTMTNLPMDIKKYTKFFNINLPNEKERSAFTFQRNGSLIEKALITTGFIVFMTTDLSLTPIEVIRIYRNKDVIEKNFDELKNELDFSRLRTHVDKTTDGKIFVGFIALILRSYLLNQLTIHKKEKKSLTLSLREALLELEKIKFTTFSNQKTSLMSITKLQKDILSCFNIDHTKLIISLELLP